MPRHAPFQQSGARGNHCIEIGSMQKTTLFEPQSTPSAKKLSIPKTVTSNKWPGWIGRTILAQYCTSRINGKKEIYAAREGFRNMKIFSVNPFFYSKTLYFLLSTPWKPRRPSLLHDCTASLPRPLWLQGWARRAAVVPQRPPQHRRA